MSKVNLSAYTFVNGTASKKSYLALATKGNAVLSLKLEAVFPTSIGSQNAFSVYFRLRSAEAPAHLLTEPGGTIVNLREVFSDWSKPWGPNIKWENLDAKRASTVVATVYPGSLKNLNDVRGFKAFLEEKLYANLATFFTAFSQVEGGREITTAPMLEALFRDKLGGIVNNFIELLESAEHKSPEENAAINDAKGKVLSFEELSTLKLQQNALKNAAEHTELDDEFPDTDDHELG